MSAPGLLSGLSATLAREILGHLPVMTPDEIRRLYEALQRHEAGERERQAVIAARDTLLGFILRMQPDYKVGEHHRMLALLLEEIKDGRKDRIGVSIAPRFGKSWMISYYYPAWYLGHHPGHYVIIASHTAEQATDFSRRVRNLIRTTEYREIFPDTAVTKDSKAAGRWETTAGGIVHAVGAGGAVAGKGAHLIVCDDPIKEGDILSGNYESLERVYQWFTYGLRTRLMPGGKIAILHTRWAPHDLLGRLEADAKRDPTSDQYEMVSFPAILPSGKPLWPEQWPLKVLLRTKASMPLFQWNAQYMQEPTPDGGAIVPRTAWQQWPDEEPPKLDWVCLSYDTAYQVKERSDFSACTVWGIWTPDEMFMARNFPDWEPGSERATCAILLNAWKEKLEFPDLKRRVRDDYERWAPDSVIIEAKASGASLAQELRRIGVPVTEFSPSRGNDKVVRLNSVSDLFASGMVWAPQHKWAEEVIEEVAAFPAVQHDDYTDTVSAALIRIRQGGLLRLPTDWDDEDDDLAGDAREEHRGVYF